MFVDLMGGMRLQREEFTVTSFTCPDDVFCLFLVKDGAFSVHDGTCERIVRATEAFLFIPTHRYERHVLSPLDFFQFFIHRTPNAPFEEDLIRFRDAERIRSTMRMLATLDTRLLQDRLAARCVLLDDLILQYHLERHQTEREQVRDTVVAQFLMHLESVYHKRIVLADEIEKTGISYAQFFRRFQKTTGVSPIEYLIRLRMNKARDLLSATELPVSEIARLCGYENEFYFSNAFKKRTERSPTAYRASLRRPIVR